MHIFRVCYRCYQTHYEVLNLPRNCTSKEIKNAFIKLSKEHHPDVNKNELSHARFQAINEAYKVLGKPETRHYYDLGLTQSEFPHVNRYSGFDDNHGAAHQNIYKTPTDPLFWNNRDTSQDKYYKGRPYYGIDGIPRLSNGAILMFCIFFAFIGVGLQYIAITKSRTLQRDELIRRSLETENLLKRTKEIANANGNEVQLQALRSRLLGGKSKQD